MRTTPDVSVGDGRLALIAGPCVVESRELVLEVAGQLAEACERSASTSSSRPASTRRTAPPAGRSARSASTGALEILAEVEGRARACRWSPTSTRPGRWRRSPRWSTSLQIPAFLCRQTDLLRGRRRLGRAVNVKKGQFMARRGHGASRCEKVRDGGGDRVLLTERGTTFGYHDLVVDFRGLAIDARVRAGRSSMPPTACSRPAAPAGRRAGGASSWRRWRGRRSAFGVDGLFLETHPIPTRRSATGPTCCRWARMAGLLEDCLAIRAIPRAGARG